MSRGPFPKAEIAPFPVARRLMVDGGILGRGRHTVHGLVEFDVTRPRALLRAARSSGAAAPSFLAFFLSCLGRAVAEDPSVQACRDRLGRVVRFAEVDVNLLVEVDTPEGKGIRPCVIRNCGGRSPLDLHGEIERLRAERAPGAESGFVRVYGRLPGPLRRALLRFLLSDPRFVKERFGTVLLSSIGMFGTGSGWGIPVPNHALQLTLGGQGERLVPGPAGPEHRRFLCATISVDHDLVDGAPAARFAQRLRRLVERADGL